MTRTFISPMGDPSFANVAEALFPSARTRAAIKMAGAQYQGQLGSNRQTELENVGLEDQNSAWAAGPEATGMSPQDFAIARLGRTKASPDSLGSFIAKQVETRMRQGAVERASGGDYTGANAQLFGVANGPVAVDQIQSGYRLNPYDTGGGMAATGETLADIAYKNAQAQASQASAGANSALEAQRRDEMANPGKYRAGRAPADISPSESLALDKLVGNYLPPVADGENELPAQIDPALRNEILSRSAELYQRSGNAQASVAQAFAELAQQSQAGGEAVPEVDRFDFGTGLRDTPGQPAKPYKFDRRAPAAAPGKPAGRTVTRTGTLNGRRVVQYSDGAVEYAP